MANVLDIKYFDSLNGVGLRHSIFFAGCTHNCKGCFNPQSHDHNAGQYFSVDAHNRFITVCAQSLEYIDGITLTGGDCFHVNNVETAYKIAKEIKDKSNLTVWAYTGYEFEYLLSRAVGQQWNLLYSLDVLVDGKFVQELHDPNLLFRGSSNQRIIDVGKSLKEGSVRMWEQNGYAVTANTMH